MGEKIISQLNAVEYLCLVWKVQGHSLMTIKQTGVQHAKEIHRRNTKLSTQGKQTKVTACATVPQKRPILRIRHAQALHRACKLTTNCILKLHSRDSLLGYGYH